MNKLKGKIMESLASVMPITLLVIALSAFVVPMPGDTLLMFLGGAVLLIVGMGFFSLGADMSMMPMGEGVGKQITLLRKISGHPFSGSGSTSLYFPAANSSTAVLTGFSSSTTIFMVLSSSRIF